MFFVVSHPVILNASMVAMVTIKWPPKNATRRPRRPSPASSGWYGWRNAQNATAMPMAFSTYGPTTSIIVPRMASTGAAFSITGRRNGGAVSLADVVEDGVDPLGILCGNGGLEGRVERLFRELDEGATDGGSKGDRLCKLDAERGNHGNDSGIDTSNGRLDCHGVCGPQDQAELARRQVLLAQLEDVVRPVVVCVHQVVLLARSLDDLVVFPERENAVLCRLPPCHPERLDGCNGDHKVAAKERHQEAQETQSGLLGVVRLEERPERNSHANGLFHIRAHHVDNRPENGKHRRCLLNHRKEERRRRVLGNLHHLLLCHLLPHLFLHNHLRDRLISLLWSINHNALPQVCHVFPSQTLPM